MGYKVLLVDGHHAGATVEVESAHATDVWMPVPQPLDVWSLSDPTPQEPNFQQDHYYIIRIKMFGYWLLAGTLKYPPDEGLLFNALASERAKAVVIS